MNITLENLQNYQKIVCSKQSQFIKEQLDVVNALINRKKLLLVKRIGWGKLTLFLICTKIFKEKGKGISLYITSSSKGTQNLIGLAKKLDLNLLDFESFNTQKQDTIKSEILDGKFDLIMISLKTVADTNFVKDFLNIIERKFELVMIDDAEQFIAKENVFRQEYINAINVIQRLSTKCSIMMAANCSYEGIKTQIQEYLPEVIVHKSNLFIPNLYIQTEIVANEATKLAILYEKISSFSKESLGFVITSNMYEADLVTEWLNEKGISCLHYHASEDMKIKSKINAYHNKIKDDFFLKKVKVIVFIDKVVKGFETSKARFIIHFQKPKNLQKYYKQIALVGYNTDKILALVLDSSNNYQSNSFMESGINHKSESTNDNQSFIQVSQNDYHAVVDILKNNKNVTSNKISYLSNLPLKTVDTLIHLLMSQSPAPVKQLNTQWEVTGYPFVYPQQKIDKINLYHANQYQKINEYIKTKKCKASFLFEQLGSDEEVLGCCCENCLGKKIVQCNVNHKSFLDAKIFLKKQFYPIKPRMQFLNTDLKHYKFPRKISPELRADKGGYIARYFDGGFYNLYIQNKKDGTICDELINAAADAIKNKLKTDELPEWLCCVPSKENREFVTHFVMQLAMKLEIPFYDVIKRVKKNSSQKIQLNSYNKIKNLDGVFEVTQMIPKGPVLLIDVEVDSGWTFTILSALLKQADCRAVYPFALISTKS